MVYWLSVLGLLVLGVLTGFTIGPFVLLIAFAMLVLGPFRHRPQIFWPPMAAVLAFIVGDLAVGPLYCEAHADLSGSSSTVCSSLLGIVEYRGTGSYNPPHQPGIVAGLVSAGAVAVVVAVAAWRRARSH